jgi:hypothetical protein
MRVEKIILSILIALAVASTALVLFSRQKPSDVVVMHEVKQVVGKTPTKRTAFKPKPIKQTEPQSAVPKMTIQQKLDWIIISDLHINKQTRQSAFEILINESQRLDPEGAGITVIFEDISEDELLNRKETVTFHGASLGEAFQFLSKLMGYGCRIESQTLLITPIPNPLAGTISKAYRLKSDIASKPEAQLLIADPKQFLQEYGIQFPDGTSIHYNQTQNDLDSTHFQEVLDSIQEIIEPFIELSSENDKAKALLRQKADSIIIKKIEFKDAPLLSVIHYLVKEGRAVDPQGRGVNIIVNLENASDLKVSIPLQEISLFSAIKYLTILNGLKYRIEPEAIVITSNLDNKQTEEISAANQAKATISQKLHSIIIKNIEFHDTPVLSAIQHLVEETRPTNPQEKPINIITNFDKAKDRKITLTMRDVPLTTVLTYLAHIAGLRLHIEPNAVVIDPSDSSVPPSKESLAAQDPASSLLKAPITKKLNSIIIKSMEWNSKSPILVQIQQLIDESRKADPEGIGVNIIANFDTAKFDATAIEQRIQSGITQKTDTPSPISTHSHGYTMRNIPVITHIKYFTTVTGLKYRIEPDAVYIESTTTGKPHEFQTRAFSIPSKVILGILLSKKSQIKNSENSLQATQIFDVREIFEEYGIQFPRGTSASYYKAQETLVITNSSEALDQIAQICAPLH